MKKKENKKMPTQRPKVIQPHPISVSVYELFYLLSMDRNTYTICYRL